MFIRSSNASCVSESEEVWVSPNICPVPGFSSLLRLYCDRFWKDKGCCWVAYHLQPQGRTIPGPDQLLRRLIRNYSSVAAPLTAHTSNNIHFSWPSNAVAAFQEFKHHFSSAPLLTLPDPDKQFTLEVDASDTEVGAVLSQHAQNNNMHPCTFFSHHLSPSNAITASITGNSWQQSWHYLLEGAAVPFVIWTDHLCLEYLKSAWRLNPCQARWSLFFNWFNFTLTCQPGFKNGKPDILSHLHLPPQVNKQPDCILYSGHHYTAWHHQHGGRSSEGLSCTLWHA